MIKGNLKNTDEYRNIFPGINYAFEFISKGDLNNTPDGKYNIINDDIYANVQTYQTKDNGPFEAHRRYIDLQFIISGEEKIGVADIKNCKTTEPYDETRDVEFLETNNYEYINLKAGEFLILPPEDVHKPCITINTSTKVKKVVVKISTKFKA